MSPGTARTDRTFLDKAGSLELTGGEAELADWFAGCYGCPEDGEALRWFLLFILCRHWQGHLLVKGPQRDESFTDTFATMAPAGENETAAQLRERAGLLARELDALTKRNPVLFGTPDSRSPVVMENGCYSFRRFWQREESLIARLKELCNPLTEPDETITESDDPSRRAVALLKNKRLLIISGGPGTGKTTLIGRLLKEWLAGDPCSGKRPRIALAAPTGRAATRLMETLSGDPSLPDEALTLHKLLAFRRGQEGPGRNRTYPLATDLVVVDEASMIDFNMMGALFDALPDNARLILVGDRDQLPSVGGGAILSDFLDGADKPGHRLYGGVVLLDKIHRSIPGITLLADAVKKGDPSGTLSLLKGGSSAVRYASLPSPAELPALLSGLWGEPSVSGSGFPVPLENWKSVSRSIEKALDGMGETGILTPVKRGLYGTRYLNGILERRAVGWHGRPVMMTVNNYELELFNGDRGMVFGFHDALSVFFRDADRGLRHFPLSRLDGLETAYAQTVHKSQGSEFRRVYLFFPETGEGLQTREILYTGITRAREQVTLYSSDPLVEKGVIRRVSRDSRIRESLAGSPAR